MTISLAPASGPEAGGGTGSFLPAEYVRGKNEHRANVMALLLLGAVTCGTVGAFMVTNRRWEGIRAEQAAIAAQFEEEGAKIEQLKALEGQRLEMVEKAEVVNALIDRVPRSVLLGELTRELPGGLVLTGVKLEGKRVVPEKPRREAADDGKRSLRGSKDKKGDEEPKEPERLAPPRFEHTLLVEGRSGANNDIADYFGRLRTSPLFGEAELVAIEEARGGDGLERTFRLRLVLSPDADARRVAGASETTLSEDGAAGGPGADGAARTAGVDGTEG